MDVVSEVALETNPAKSMVEDTSMWVLLEGKTASWWRDKRGCMCRLPEAILVWTNQKAVKCRGIVYPPTPRCEVYARNFARLSAFE